MVSKELVRTLYRVMLRREPESEEVVDLWASFESFNELLEAFTRSEEFKSRFQRISAPLDWPLLSIDICASEPTLAKLLHHIEDNWTTLGQLEPYYSVLSSCQYLGDAFPENRTSFFESGQIEINRLFNFAARSAVELPVDGTCFELGCGVGRLTRCLAERFRRVIAADISQTHLDLAKRTVEQKLNNREVEFMCLNSPNAINRIRNYDIFFSVIVLQHNPPPIISHLLSAGLGRLKRGGFAYFQVPTYMLGYSFNIDRYLTHVSQGGLMEMHVLPQKDIIDILHAHDCNILEIREDDYTGHLEGISNTFFVRKR